MNKENPEVNLLIINNDFSETEMIQACLDKDMHATWRMIHCINLEEAHSCVSKVDLVILKPELDDTVAPKEVFKNIAHMVFETPIIVITDHSKVSDDFSTYVMEKGAADTVIRGQFSRLVDAVEFALIRNEIIKSVRKTNDKELKDVQECGDDKYQKSCAEREQELAEHKRYLSMFMEGYSVSNPNSER